MKHITNKILKFTLIVIIFGTVSCEVQEKYNDDSLHSFTVENFSLQSIQ